MQSTNMPMKGQILNLPGSGAHTVCGNYSALHKSTLRIEANECIQLCFQNFIYKNRRWEALDLSTTVHWPAAERPRHMPAMADGEWLLKLCLVALRDEGTHALLHLICALHRDWSIPGFVREFLLT